MTIELRDRIIGCIVGGAIGDAVGLPFEGHANPLTTELKGRQISDDTQLTLATCEAIIENNGIVDAASIARTFAAWHRNRRVERMGASTLKALSELVAGGHWALVGRKGEYAAGNGAAMRIAPLAFCLDPKVAEDSRLIRDVSRITHHNEEAFAGALAVTLAIRAACDRSWNGESGLLPLIVSFLPDSKLRDRLIEIDGLGSDVSIADLAARFGCSGYVVESVPLSLYGAQRLSRIGFAALLRELVSIGGDTDTIASISGQISGAILGAEHLPQHLIKQLDESALIESQAHRFADTVVDKNAG